MICMVKESDSKKEKKNTSFPQKSGIEEIREKDKREKKIRYFTLMTHNSLR